MKSIKPQAKKTLLLLLINTIILMGIYFWLPIQLEFSYLPAIYFGVGAVLLLYYVIYNRGFVGKNATPDMLPDTMSQEEKQEIIESSRNRLEKSKWVLTILVPIMLVFAVDMIYMYLIPMLFGGNR